VERMKKPFRSEWLSIVGPKGKRAENMTEPIQRQR
jgi:hypothetical protein